MPSSCRIAIAEYNHATDGGTEGTRYLQRNDRIPANSIITRQTVDVLTPLASGGAAVITLGYEDEDNIFAETGFDGLNTPYFGNNLVSGLKTDSTVRVKITIGGAPLTAGRLRIYSWFVASSA